MEDSDRLVLLIYDDLRRIAASMLRDQRKGHTLEPTALVHEAFLKILGSDAFGPEADRQQLCHLCVLAMRQVLTDYHRHRVTRKGPGRLRRHPIEAALDHVVTVHQIDIMALDEALDELTRIDPRASAVVTLTTVLGQAIPEAAALLGISRATAERDVRYARAWLRDRLKGDEPS